MKKEILIFEDPGIPRSDVEEKAAGLDYQLVWNAEEATPEAVEVLVTIKKEVNREVMERFPNLKMVAVAFTGYDAVDTEVCGEKNIAVYNVPAYATNSVAELAVGLSISFLREIPKADQLVKNKNWDLKPGFDLADKIVGIVGTGTIGIATAKLFKAFGCTIIGWSRTEKDEFVELGGTYVDEFQELFSKADIVSVHLPLNEATRGIVGFDEMAAMKETGFIINTARGPIINETDLIKILKDRKIAGAALDVFDVEPISSDNELLTLDNVILTPHIAYKTKEALQRRAQVTIDNIKDFMSGEAENRIN